VTWGVRFLSPVGGVLTAVGGLLVVNLLADPNIKLLGEVFRDTWGRPAQPIALAIALLFGFSGRMFSNMAITASSQIAGSGPPQDAKATGGTGEGTVPKHKHYEQQPENPKFADPEYAQKWLRRMDHGRP
jgi:hypothetical protein